MENLNAQVFTAEQVCQETQLTYEQNEKIYSNLTESKTFQNDPNGSDILLNEPNIPENIAVNEQGDF